ncbi:pulmonary surfactant-associated protein D-like [Elgaria multicarinata webbii]|uniref:pulmonary surfactant-associated protein D-like n=1 Tax=Elgaria multicarinata webbii TaxID=159646 RepID=UPI002FCD3D9D
MTKSYIEILLVLLILLPLALGVSLQRITSSDTKHVLQGWVPNACTLVICASAETGPTEDKGEQGIPAAQELWGPAGTPGPQGDKELELLKTQIRDLQTQLDTFKDTTNKIQRVLLNPNGGVVGGKIFKTDGSTGDYDTAKASCSHMGGAVAVPRDAAENSALQQMVSWHNKRVVLGIHDMGTEGRFEYLDGQVIGYSNWAPGEPNNVGNEDCVEMHPDGTWHDRSCAIPWLIVCEF